jgi:hypothetical protein
MACGGGFFYAMNQFYWVNPAQRGEAKAKAKLSFGQ